MAIRVLLVSAEYPPAPGGIGDYTALLAAHLAAEGVTVSVLTSGNGECRPDGPVSVYATVRKWDWNSVEAVHGAIRRAEPDIVHLQYQTGMYGMHPATNFLPDRLAGHVPVLHILPHERRWQYRFITTFHDLRHPYLFPKAGPLRLFVTRHLARLSNAVIATNGADVALLRAWGANATLVPIGSNIPAASSQDVSTIRSRYGIAPNATLLTTFGLINQSKGMDTLIETLALLRRGGLNVHLLLVGAGAGVNDPTNKETEHAFTAQCAALDVASSVTRTGPLSGEDVARALAASDVCLLPYRDGASPRRGSLLAAITQGIPVVTTTPAANAYHGLPALRDGDTAVFVPPDDPRALADAARAAIDNVQLATALRAGAATYARQFAWPAIARQILACYGGTRVSDDANDRVEATISGMERS